MLLQHCLPYTSVSVCWWGEGGSGGQSGAAMSLRPKSSISVTEGELGALLQPAHHDTWLLSSAGTLTDWKLELFYLKQQV